MNRCNICLDKKCSHKECNCSTCKNISVCNKYLYPTIRLTTKCTQSCSHCCFDCSPNKSDFMSVKTAKVLIQFLKNNEIMSCNLMGGEFFLNPDWKEILDLILPEMVASRLVTNGDWVEDNSVIEFLAKYKEILKVSISKDRWHTNKNVDKAAELCEKNGIEWNFPIKEENSEESVVPSGRGFYTYGFYSVFGCYCHNPAHCYSFLIDEQGDIFKCSFGYLNYANIFEYEKGSFDKRFKEFNLKFYDAFISNCARCIEANERE